MGKRRYYLTLWAMAAGAVLTISALTAATYAWFSANRKVETDKVTARTGSTNLTLQISRSGGGDFSSVTQTDTEGAVYAKGTVYSVVSLRDPEGTELLPVSTEDLKTFVISPLTEDGQATEQTLRLLHTNVEEENTAIGNRCYRDTLYLRLVGDDSIPSDTKADLYLDGLKNLPVLSRDSRLYTAARLGLTFGEESPLIFRFEADEKDAVSNTILDGKQLAAGLVLTERGGSIVPSEGDPARLLSDYQYSESNPNPTPLLRDMKLGQIYRLDICFYLEGCDPDCLVNRVGAQEAGLALAFYAVPL